MTPMLLGMKPPQKDLCMARELSSCAALSKSQWMGGGFGWLFMSTAASRGLSVVLTNRSAVLRSQPRHSVPANLACDKGRPVNSYGQAGEIGGNMQLSSTCWHLMHPVQDRPDNCAHKEQFRYKPTSPEGLADHRAVAAQLQYTAKVHTGYLTTG